MTTSIKYPGTSSKIPSRGSCFPSHPIIISDVIPELTEESGQDPIVEGVTFYVRYLGSCFVINKAGDEATSEAIKSIVSMVSKIKICNILFIEIKLSNCLKLS